ncbi:hypothetical protein FRC09_004533 [Ceratobasidium sp. 395]|nr:hypothetical protein FRC09_004533 [Ceratobasidium sp. 395]
MAPDTRSKSRKASNPGYMRTDTGAASTSVRNALLPEQTLKIKCEKVLHLIKTLGLSFGQFVLAVSYGEDSLRDVPSAVDARESLYNEDTLTRFLGLCLEPPRAPSGGGPRPSGGTKTTRKFIFTKARETFRSELKDFSGDYELPNKQLNDMDYIATITTSSLNRRMKAECPELYALLSSLTVPRPPDTDSEIDEDGEEEMIGPRKPCIEPHPNFDIVLQIASMAFRLNPRKNTLQKIITVFMHARHTAKPVIDFLNQSGQAMSYSWVRRQVSNLSLALREEVILAVRTNPFLIVHDNIRLKYPVRSQRGNNQTTTDNGTASSVIILPKFARAFENADDIGPFLRTLRAKRRAGTAPRLCYRDLSHPAQRLANQTAYIYDILDILALIPELAGLDIWKSNKLKRPVGPQQLPSGPEHRMKQYMLPTTNIDESSYSGNSQFVPFTLSQLGFDSEHERMRLVLERLIPWIGDRMTAIRCRMIQAFRQGSINGFSRWDSLIFIFGGLHCMMALSSAILELYRGSNVGATFGADIITLSRTGLQKQSGGKPDFHTVDEFLKHELEANIRGLFDELTGCSTGESRAEWAKSCTPTDLYKLATRILNEHASGLALDADKSNDELHAVIIKRHRDLLLFYSLRRAFKYGDIDRIEAILPELLFFFVGAGNGQYADEIYQFLQLLTHETTPDLRAAILRHSLLVNNMGQPDSFYPIDQRQELNNKGIREYGPPPQNSSWEQYGKASRVIPFYMGMIEHVEDDIIGISRSHIRKEVKHELDIQALMKEHHKHQIHTVVPGRKLKAADKPKDVRKAGVTTIREKSYLEDQYEKRAVYFRWSSTLQEPVYVPTPPPSPVSAPRAIHNASPIELEEEDIAPQSTGTTPPLDEDGVAPWSDDPAVELLVVELAGMGLSGAN